MTKGERGQIVFGLALAVLLLVWAQIMRVEADTNVACTSANSFNCLRDINLGRDSEYVKLNNRAVDTPIIVVYAFPTAASATPVLTPQAMVSSVNTPPTPGPYIGCAVRNFAGNPGLVCLGDEPLVTATSCTNGLDLQPGEMMKLPAVNGDCDWIKVNIPAPGTTSYRIGLVAE